MFTNDTNILVYSVDFADAKKHRLANRLVTAHAQLRYPLVLQSLTEFYWATTRKSLLPKTEASRFVTRTLTISPISTANSEDALNAMRLHLQTGHQFFDCLLLATAARSGCITFFSEDFQHNRTYGTITVRNPFLMPDAELDALLQ